MIPVQNTIFTSRLTISEIQAFDVNGALFSRHIFDPPLRASPGDSITLEWRMDVSNKEAL